MSKDITIPTAPPSILQDCFKKENGTEILIRCNYWTDFKWSGTVKFKNGDTSGSQDFNKHEDPYILLDAIRAFIDSLPSKTTQP